MYFICLLTGNHFHAIDVCDDKGFIVFSAHAAHTFN